MHFGPCNVQYMFRRLSQFLLNMLMRSAGIQPGQMIRAVQGTSMDMWLKIDVILLKNQAKSFFRTLFFFVVLFYPPNNCLWCSPSFSWNYQQPRCQIEKKNLASGSESRSGMFTFTNCSFAVLRNWPKVDRAADHVDGQVLGLDQELLCHCVSSCLDYREATSAMH